MCFCFCFGFDSREELGGHHLCCALKHSLAHARNCAANLHVALIADNRQAAASFETDFSRALHEPRLAFAFDDHPEVSGRLKLLEANISSEDPFDRTDPNAQRRGVGVVAGPFEAFAPRDATLQHSGIDQCLVDAFTAGMQFVRAFDLHRRVDGVP